MRDDFDTKWSAILAKVPKGKNPFDFVQRNMDLRAHGRHSGGTFTVLIVLTVLAFINILVVLFCFFWILLNGREGRSRHLWLIRYVRTKDKKFVIAPNSSLFTIIFQSPSSAAALVYLLFVCKNLKYARELNLQSSSVWFNVTFLLSYIGLWTSGWGYWSASLSRQPKDLLITDRVLSSRLSAICGAIWCSLAGGLYIFSLFMMQASLNISLDSDSQLRAQLQKYARVWTKSPKAANPHDLASLFNHWRVNQHTFALWRTFTGTLQGVMSLLLCVLYLVAGSALQRIQNLDNGSSPRAQLPSPVEKPVESSKPKMLKSFKISKIELLILYCYAMVICTLGHSFSLLVCYNLSHRSQWALSVTGDDALLKILPLTLISVLSSILTWKAVVRRKMRTPKADTELSVQPPPPWAPLAAEAKQLNTFHPANHALMSPEGTQDHTFSISFPYPKPQKSNPLKGCMPL
ncbi:hypothetical protein PtA15_3A128 [Puccinia triticina]|uniref:Uncharacterized protein n=1 Tax=Puccinia triticina TaxID=208348 RepID=A0ABY7CDJ3_9BASI|nr:uncharacterized protein PtA15_3A128 [Puccinia triticina]WAQ82764.1 hypothetical protein PtA15_3A128 [Puccinia triticina]WAR53603.1 hypothetical protein PtB15_3B111 [Puccinia triticina]